MNNSQSGGNFEYQQLPPPPPDYQYPPPPPLPKTKLKSKKLLTLKAIIIIINIVLATISITSLYTVASGKFQVILPEEGTIYYELLDDMVVFKANVTILNGGLYSIKDLTINVGLVEEITNYSLIDYSQTIEEIPSQTNRIEQIEIPLKIDFEGWMDAGLDTIVFNDSTLNLSVYVEAFYTMKLVRFYADYSLEWPWEAPIKAYSFDPLDVRPKYENDKLTLELPYRLYTAGWLARLGDNIIVEAKVSNIDKVIAWVSEDIPLGRDYYGKLEFDVAPVDFTSLLTKSQQLILNMDVSAPDGEMIFTKSITYNWNAPLESLALGLINFDNIQNILSVPLSFINTLPSDLNFIITTTLLNENGINIGTKITQIEALAGLPIEEIVDVSYSDDGTPTSIKITFVDQNTGLMYVYEQNLEMP